MEVILYKVICHFFLNDLQLKCMTAKYTAWFAQILCCTVLHYISINFFQLENLLKFLAIYAPATLCKFTRKNS